VIPLVLICNASTFVVMGATSGINGATGERPFRQDIATMAQTGGPLWDLYILAVQQFQTLDQSDQL
jgi:hypothetical protein